MIGKLKLLKWTEKPSSSRDLVFIILILGFGIVLVAKLSPYFAEKHKSVITKNIQTLPTTPKEILDAVNAPLTASSSASNGKRFVSPFAGLSGGDRNKPSIVERPIFDGNAVILKVRSLNPYSSRESNPPLEVTVLSPLIREADSEQDFGPAEGAKLVGSANSNVSTKRLYINFSELITRSGRSFPIEGQAIQKETLSAGIVGDYSSGLPLRLLGVALDRTIMAADQVGMAYLFSSIGPDGSGSQEFKKAAMETNQQASQNIAAETTKDLRETPAEISLPTGSVFYVRVKAQSGVHQ